MSQSKKKKPESNKKSNPLKEYSKFSSLAFQMLAIIGILVWFGLWLDQTYRGGKPLYVLIGTVLGISSSFYLIFKSVLNTNDDL